MDKESKVISESELEKVNGGVLVKEHIENPDVSTDCQFFKAKYGIDPNEKKCINCAQCFRTTWNGGPYYTCMRKE